MNNKQVQEKLCTAPKETPVEALQFAIALEDCLKKQNPMDKLGKNQKLFS